MTATMRLGKRVARRLALSRWTDRQVLLTTSGDSGQIPGPPR